MESSVPVKATPRLVVPVVLGAHGCERELVVGGHGLQPAAAEPDE